jgi:hypothetical protein
VDGVRSGDGCAGSKERFHAGHRMSSTFRERRDRVVDTTDTVPKVQLIEA